MDFFRVEKKIQHRPEMCCRILNDGKNRTSIDGSILVSCYFCSEKICSAVPLSGLVW